MNPLDLLDKIQKKILPNINEPLTYIEGNRDCILVIDASISMWCRDWKPSRIRAAMDAGQAFIMRLASEEPEARVAVVIYGDKAQLLLGLTEVTQYSNLTQNIYSIKSRGNTNITSGLDLAQKILERPGHVVLLTDGQHNTGLNPKSVANNLKNHAIIDCVGIGGTPSDVDEKLLRYIASPYPDGTKRYRWIGDKEKLIQHFHNLAGRLSKN